MELIVNSKTLIKACQDIALNGHITLNKLEKTINSSVKIVDLVKSLHVAKAIDIRLSASWYMLFT